MGVGVVVGMGVGVVVGALVEVGSLVAVSVGSLVAVSVGAGLVLVGVGVSASQPVPPNPGLQTQILVPMPSALSTHSPPAPDPGVQPCVSCAALQLQSALSTQGPSQLGAGHGLTEPPAARLVGNRATTVLPTARNASSVHTRNFEESFITLPNPSEESPHELSASNYPRSTPEVQTFLT